MNRLLSISFVVIFLLVFAVSVQAAPPSPYVNILANSDFSSAFSNWSITSQLQWDVVSGVMEIYVPTGGSGSLSQVTAYSASTGDPYDLTLQLGNSSNQDKNITLRLDGAFANPATCNFVIPTQSPLQPYRLRAQAPGEWSTIRFIILGLDADSLPAILIDNVNLQYHPASQVSGVVCDSPPTPTPTPALALTWALPTQVINGTPQPAQYVSFTYEMSAGDVAVSGLLIVLVITLVCVFMFWLYLGRKRRGV